MAKHKTIVDIAKEMAEARSDINALYCIIGALENGTISYKRSREKSKIIELCWSGVQKSLLDLDRAKASLEEIAASIKTRGPIK